MRLPLSAQEFERVIGRELTLKLSEIVKPSKRGGRIYIPARPMADDHPIARQIGLDAANKLHKAFGGSLMPLSTCRSAKRQRAIVQGFVKGFGTRDLAASHGCSEKTVARALQAVTTRDLVGWGAQVVGFQVVAKQQNMRSPQPKTSSHPPGLGSFGGGLPAGSRRTAESR